MDLLKPGQEFAGRYRVERFLAAGGMGAVYVAEQLATELRVALKILFPQVLASQDAVQKFEIEAKIAARVRSENIVQVLDAGFDQETRMPFLVMELLEGRPLEDLVLESGPLTAEQTVTYLAQTASGLDKAHFHKSRNGAVQPIVHRDLKPENLFLTHRENGEPVIKILDFGIAKVLTDTAHLSQEIKGTPLFMAFEQAAGKQITPQTDIWALGLIAFFFLTGKSYWRSASNPLAGLPALFAEVLSEPLVAPAQRALEIGVTPTWGGEFDEWLLRCLRREPAERHESAGAAAAALAAALNVDLNTLSSRSLSGQQTRKNDLANSATIAVTAVTNQGVTLSQTGPVERRSKAPLWLGAALVVLSGGAFAGYQAFGAGVGEPVQSEPLTEASAHRVKPSADVPTERASSSGVQPSATAAETKLERPPPKVSATITPVLAAPTEPASKPPKPSPPAVQKRPKPPRAAKLPVTTQAPPAVKQPPKPDLWNER